MATDMDKVITAANRRMAFPCAIKHAHGVNRRFVRMAGQHEGAFSAQQADVAGGKVERFRFAFQYDPATAFDNGEEFNFIWRRETQRPASARGKTAGQQ